MTEITMPEVTILILTYNRYSELRKTVNALQKNILYPRSRLNWVISDDSTGDGYLEKMESLKSHKGIEHISTKERSGWGANANQALLHIAQNYPDTHYVFQIEDDYVLKTPLDLVAGVALMENRKNIGMLRYRGTSGDHFIMHQFQASIENIKPDFQESPGANKGHIAYMQFDNASHSAWIYSNGAHLKRFNILTDETIGFHMFYGKYPEGLKLGKTELNYAMQVKTKMREPNAPAIAILPDWITMNFEHIGKSWQQSEHDIGE